MSLIGLNFFFRGEGNNWVGSWVGSRSQSLPLTTVCACYESFHTHANYSNDIQILITNSSNLRKISLFPSPCTGLE